MLKQINKKTILFCSLVFGGLLLALGNISPDWGTNTTVACILYTIIITVFLLAQLVGFLLSHAHYSEAIEEPKFRLLEIEANNEL